MTVNDINERSVLRTVLENVMEKNGILDEDIEQVDLFTWYSRGVRTLCVLDARFEYQIGQATDQFIRERKVDQTIQSQTYETRYGTVVIRLVEPSKIVVALSDSFEPIGELEVNQ